MSLYRQLWIAIALLMFVVFGITFLINGLSSSRYLEQQLSIKNADDASALALSLSQQDLDEITLEIQLATQLDQGSYEWVAFRDPEGTVIFDRRQEFGVGNAPGWLQLLFPIQSSPGSADVSNGWNLLGTVSLKSHDGFAYTELWAGARRTLIALLLAILAAGSVGSLLLRLILRPLGQVVEQAEAIGERRFLSLPEPYTTELAQVTRAMNALAGRVKDMLSRESRRLEQQREETERDSLTGLLKRVPFLRRLRARLESENADSEGSVAMLRLNNLAHMNQLFGRKTMDTLLKDLGETLRGTTFVDSDAYVASDADVQLAIGRLNGSDFCVLAPRAQDPQKLGDALQRAFQEVVTRYEMLEHTSLPTACTQYSDSDSVGEVLADLDEAMLLAESEEERHVILATRGDVRVTSVREEANHWQDAITAALADHRLQLEHYPVVDAQGTLIHEEGMLRIRFRDELLNAGVFMPWVHRLNLIGEVDRAVICLALDHIAATGTPSCVNLSTGSLADPGFPGWIEQLFREHREAAAKLSLDVGESVAFAHLDGFHKLRQRVQAAGGHVGLEHMGYRLSEINLLSELGADYLKIDGLFIRDIDSNEGYRALLRTYASIARSLGIACIAEGVSTEAERIAALDCGATGVTGRGVTLQG